MSLTSELSELVHMKENGHLTDLDFEISKKHIIERYSNQGQSVEVNTIGKAANRAVTYWIGLTIFGFILAVILFFSFFLPYWNQISSEQARMRSEFNKDYEETNSQIKKHQEQMNIDRKKFDEEFEKTKKKIESGKF